MFVANRKTLNPTFPRWNLNRQTTQKVAKVGRQREQLQPHLIGDETAAGEPRSLQGVLALRDPLLGSPGLVVEPDHIPGPPGQVRHNETDAGIQFPSMPFDLHHNPSRIGPGGSPVLETGNSRVPSVAKFIRGRPNADSGTILSAKLVEYGTAKQTTLFADSEHASRTHTFSRNRAWPEDAGQNACRCAQSKEGLMTRACSWPRR
jgi:hypothetical protein